MTEQELEVLTTKAILLGYAFETTRSEGWCWAISPSDGVGYFPTFEQAVIATLQHAGVLECVDRTKTLQNWWKVG